MFNPFTLLVGPCLVAYVIYKSTIPVDDGGYHLPWWYVIDRVALVLSQLTKDPLQERSRFVHRLAVRNANGKALSASLEQPKPHHIRASLHRLWLLFRNNEAICSLHTSRGSCQALIKKKFTHCFQTGWGTRSGIGDISAATAAVDAGSRSDEKTAESYPIQPVAQPQSPFSDDYAADMAYAKPERQRLEYEEPIYAR